MNYGIVIRILGNLLFFVALAMLFPLGIAFFTNGPDTMAFAYSILLTCVVGLLMSLFPERSQKIRAREALAIVTFGWILAAIFGAFPFLFSGAATSVVDAFFESMSGLTTTGSTILNNLERMPQGILFWRSLTHWLGGMGILVLTLAILPLLGVGGFQIYKAETPGPLADKLVPRMKDTAKILYLVYGGLTLIQTLLLLAGGMNLYQAVVHAFSTVGTGGFSPYTASVGFFNSAYIHYIIAFFMLISGINFSLFYEAYKKRFRDIWTNSELRLYLGIILICTLLITLALLHSSVYQSVIETVRHAFFQVVSFITTTGFTTTNYENWPAFCKTILFFLMFVGGSAGSSAGSIKVIRLLLVLKLVRREIGRILHPRAHIPIQLNGKVVGNDVAISVVSFYGLYILLFVIASILLSIEGIGFLSATSAAATALGNVGIGFEFIGPTQTFSAFSASSKLLLTFLMLLGRLELFTVFLLFVPSFWRD